MLFASQAALPILSEDAEFLAVNKPAGLLVHPTRPGGSRTLWDELRGLLAFELATGGHVGIVNRLDRETSGVVVVAKTREAAALAGEALARREARKQYLALAFGTGGMCDFRIEAPLRRRGEFETSEVYLEQAVHPLGAPATTNFRRLGEGRLEDRRVTLFLAAPETGRTHQIRVHLAHAGFPVVGDKLYAGGSGAYLEFVREGWTPCLQSVLLHPRHALHCLRMSLCGRQFTAPLPEDFLDLLKRSGLGDFADCAAVEMSGGILGTAEEGRG